MRKGYVQIVSSQNRRHRPFKCFKFNQWLNFLVSFLLFYMSFIQWMSPAEFWVDQNHVTKPVSLKINKNQLKASNVAQQNFIENKIYTTVWHSISIGLFVKCLNGISSNVFRIWQMFVSVCVQQNEGYCDFITLNRFDRYNVVSTTVW